MRSAPLRTGSWTPPARPLRRARPRESSSNEKVVPIFEKDLTEKLDALTPPKGDDARVDAILNAGRQGIDKLRADPEASRPLRAAPRTPSAPRASSRRRTDFGAGAAKRQRFVSMAGERGPPAEWRLVTSSLPTGRQAVAGDAVPPLGCAGRRLPRQDEAHGHKAVRAVFGGLLPEGDVREVLTCCPTASSPPPSRRLTRWTTTTSLDC